MWKKGEDLLPCLQFPLPFSKETLDLGCKPPTSQLGSCRSVWSCLGLRITNGLMRGRKEWQEHLANL
ncbi:hypothetical protein LINPERHAP1_LOCUS10623 [Linum perenne]